MNLHDPWVVQIAMLPVRRPQIEPDQIEPPAISDGRRRGVEWNKRVAANNTAAILQQLRRKSLAIHQIVEATGLSRETVRKNINDLHASGAILRNKRMRWSASC